MTIQVTPTQFKDVEAMRALSRQELNCQIIHDSFLQRGLADPYLLTVDGRIAGYGAVSNKYGKGRLMEFYTLPDIRDIALPLFRELLTFSKATHIEAQTNNPLMLLMLYDCAKNITAENYLFHDAFTSQLPSPQATFRRRTPEDRGPQGEWVIQAGDAIVAAGGYLTHYNPPYADIYLEVAESARRKGFGSYFVQEAKRICYEAGHKPAARCNADHPVSRRTLEKAGMLPCARLLLGEVHHK